MSLPFHLPRPGQGKTTFSHTYSPTFESLKVTTERLIEMLAYPPKDLASCSAIADPRFPQLFIARLLLSRNHLAFCPEHNFDMRSWGRLDCNYESIHCCTPGCIAGYIASASVIDKDYKDLPVLMDTGEHATYYLLEHRDSNNRNHDTLGDNLDGLFVGEGSLILQCLSHGILPKSIRMVNETSNKPFIDSVNIDHVTKPLALEMMDAILDGVIDPFLPREEALESLAE